MAIVNNGTKGSLKPNQLPSGYVHPAVTEVADFEYKRQVVLTVLKATVENADPKTTLNNILNDLGIGITKQVTDLVTSDLIASKSVEIHAELLSISNNQQLGTTTFYNNVANSFTCIVNFFVKSA